MVEISLSGSGEGPGWVTAPGYSTAGFPLRPINRFTSSRPESPPADIDYGAGAVSLRSRVQTES